MQNNEINGFGNERECRSHSFTCFVVMVLCRMIEMQGRKKKGHTQKRDPQNRKKKEQETGELRLDGKDNPDHQEPENGERGEEKKKKKICPLHARTDGGQ